MAIGRTGAGGVDRLDRGQSDAARVNLCGAGGVPGDRILINDGAGNLSLLAVEGPFIGKTRSPRPIIKFR